MERSEAIEIVRKNYPHVSGSGTQFETALRTLIPELKESEDERIRKAILELVKQSSHILNPMNQKSMIAWLEKQGEHTKFLESIQIGDEVTRNPDGVLVNLSQFKRKAEQGSQNLANSAKTCKNEPKFKVGDWVVNKFGHLKHITKIKNDCYYAEGECGEWHGTFEYGDTHFHLWTIQEAKDGDVLYSRGLHNDCIFIFNRLDNWIFDEPNGDRAVATGYCCLSISSDKMEFGMQGPDCIEVNTIKPATKEQRDLLFQKMKEAGYEWDAEKKELRKVEQNPAWSEEDERMLNICIEHTIRIVPVKAAKNSGLIVDFKRIPDEKAQDWLKALKSRVQPQPKSEWSEEDTATISRVISIVKWAAYSDHSHPILNDKGATELLERLNSFKERYTWKPSDEQMECLLKAEGVLRAESRIAMAQKLSSLYNDLKKLTE